MFDFRCVVIMPWYQGLDTTRHRDDRKIGFACVPAVCRFVSRMRLGGRAGRFQTVLYREMENGNLYMQIKLLRPPENLFSGFQTALCF